MFPKVNFNPLNVFDLRKIAPASQPAIQAAPGDEKFIQLATSSNYSPAHPRVNDSECVSGESPHGKVLPYLLA